MFSLQDYYWGWVLYILASAGLLVVWWYLTRFIGLPLVRQLLRVAAAAALLMPYPVEQGSSFWAPALPVAFLEGLFVVDASFTRVGMPLVFAVLLAMIGYLSLHKVWHWGYARWLNQTATTTVETAVGHASPEPEQEALYTAAEPVTAASDENHHENHHENNHATETEADTTPSGSPHSS